jgi:hypothetical protein
MSRIKIWPALSIYVTARLYTGTVYIPDVQYIYRTGTVCILDGVNCGIHTPVRSLYNTRSRIYTLSLKVC